MEHFAKVVTERARPLVEFLLTHIGDDISFFAGSNLIGLNGKVNAEGTDLLVKTIIKYLK